MAGRKPPRVGWSTLPSLLRAGANPRAVLGRHIGAALREQIIVHVSSVNECAVCAAAHTVIGRAVGVSAEKLAGARQQRLPEDDRTRAALRYAEVRTQRLERESPEVVHAFEQLFDAEERREIRGVVDAFTFANHFNNTWESWLPGAGARRRWLGMQPPAEPEDEDEAPESDRGAE